MDSHGLAQDYSNSIAKAMELLQSCTKLSIWYTSRRSEWDLQGAVDGASDVYARNTWKKPVAMTTFDF